MTAPPAHVDALQLVGGLPDGWTIAWTSSGYPPPALWWRHPDARGEPPPAGMDVLEIPPCGWLAIPRDPAADREAVNAATGPWVRFAATFDVSPVLGHHIYRMEPSRCI